jgi:hypothetical protein
MRNLLNFLLFTSHFAYSQANIVCRKDPYDDKTINIKWYLPALIETRTIKLYRKESGTNEWTELNGVYSSYKKYKLKTEVFENDSELKAYVDMVDNNARIEGLTLLALLTKSFKSEIFCRYLGIWYDDQTAVPGKQYSYKFNVLENNVELTLATSDNITAGTSIRIDPPRDLKFTPGNKSISFSWRPEQQRYFAVDLYRKHQDSMLFTKVNHVPLIPSITHNNSGKETLDPVFYSDKNLQEHKTYQYYFQAIDFFGDYSLPSETLQVKINDVEAPSVIDKFFSEQDGKTMRIKWTKQSLEKDLIGYNVYRTQTNDSDFIKINAKLIPANTFLFKDSTVGIGSYYYKVSCLDQDNEAFSIPYLTEVADMDPPSKPANLILSADSGYMKLQWDRNPEKDILGYLIYRTINQSSEQTFVRLTPSPIKETNFRDVLPKNARNTFCYRIAAIDEHSNKSQYSVIVYGKMPDVTPPSAPFLTRVYSDEQKHLRLEWFSNAEPDLSGYDLFRKIADDSNSVFIKINHKRIPAIDKNYILPESLKGHSYIYYLVAVDSANNISVPSNQLRFRASAIQKDTVIFSQFKVRYDKKQGQIILKWKIKNKDSVKGYVLYYSEQINSPLSHLTGLLTVPHFKFNPTGVGPFLQFQLRAYTLSNDIFRSKIIQIKLKP